jgi:hypothetical protein
VRTQDVETQPRLWISEINMQMGSTAGKDWMTTSGQRAHRPFTGNIPSSSGRTNTNRKSVIFPTCHRYLTGSTFSTRSMLLQCAPLAT